MEFVSSVQSSMPIHHKIEELDIVRNLHGRVFVFK